MAKSIELGKNQVSAFYRIKIGEERVKRVIARERKSDFGTVLVEIIKPKTLVVFPEMLGSISIPLRGIKERKFIDPSQFLSE